MHSPHRASAARAERVRLKGEAGELEGELSTHGSIVSAAVGVPRRLSLLQRQPRWRCCYIRPKRNPRRLRHGRRHRRGRGRAPHGGRAAALPPRGRAGRLHASHSHPSRFQIFIHLIIQNKKACFFRNRLSTKKGSDILSHITAVPSAQSGLTSLFGMGRGEPRRNNHLKSLVFSLQFQFAVSQLITYNS